MLAGAGPGPHIPLLGPVKELVVDHRVLGALAGRARERVVNRYLARKLAQVVSGSRSQLRVVQGETLLRTHLRPVTLGTPCTNEVHIGRSHGSVTVARSSRFSATAGLTLNSHAPPTSDLFAHANLHVHMDLSGSFRSSVGKHMFGQCITKLSGASPMRVRGSAYGHAYAKVVVSGVRLEVRPTAANPLLGNVLNLELGRERPHLVFTFDVKLDGTLHKFHMDSLQLTGCEFKILGIKMFSNCGLVEQLIRKQVQRATSNTIPLRPIGLLREIEKTLKMRLGEEVAIPLVVQDGANLEPANRVISKTGSLIRLNVQLFQSLASLTRDMEQVKAERTNVSA